MRQQYACADVAAGLRRPKTLSRWTTEFLLTAAKSSAFYV